MGDVVRAFDAGRGDANNAVAPLQSAAGGGNSGGMDGDRIAKLESDVGHIQSDIGRIHSAADDQAKSLADVRERLARLEVKVDNLPSKEFVAAAAGKGFALLVTLVTLIGAISSAISVFQTQIKHVFGIP